MLVFARKTSLGKWSTFAETEKDIKELPADILGSELRTHGNTLSVWNIDGGDEGLKKVVLAMLTGSNVTNIETMDLILIDESQLTGIVDYEQNANEADTFIEEYRPLHFNICDLTYEKIGKVSTILVANAKEERCIKLRRRQIKDIVKNAFIDGTVTIESFCESIRPKIEKMLD